MKKIIFTLAIFLALAGCDIGKQNPDTEPALNDSIELKSSASLKYMQEVINPNLSPEKLIFYFRFPGSSPDGYPTKYQIDSQTIRGMFVIDPVTGDFYITKPYFDNLKVYSGQVFIVVIVLTHGKDITRYTWKINVDDPPVDGIHYIKRNIV